MEVLNRARSAASSIGPLPSLEWPWYASLAPAVASAAETGMYVSEGWRVVWDWGRVVQPVALCQTHNQKKNACVPRTCVSFCTRDSFSEKVQSLSSL